VLSSFFFVLLLNNYVNIRLTTYRTSDER